MYQAILDQLNGLPLLAVAFFLHWGGVVSRSRSAVALRFSFPVAIILFGTFFVYTWMQTSSSLGYFIQTEWFYMAAIAFGFHGIVAMLLHYGGVFWRATVTKPHQASVQRRLERKRERESKQRLRESEIRNEERQRAREAERPEQERRAREKAEQKRIEEEKVRSDGERREAARSEVLLLYHRHAGEIADSFSWDRFNEFVEQFMNDNLPAEKVEKNSDRLKDMILSFFETEPEPAPKRTRKEIHDQYDLERKRILECDYSEEEVEAALKDLAFREKQALIKET